MTEYDFGGLERRPENILRLLSELEKAPIALRCDNIAQTNSW